jgi:hypothetical protein
MSHRLDPPCEIREIPVVYSDIQDSSVLLCKVLRPKQSLLECQCRCEQLGNQKS